MQMRFGVALIAPLTAEADAVNGVTDLQRAGSGLARWNPKRTKVLPRLFCVHSRRKLYIACVKLLPLNT